MVTITITPEKLYAMSKSAFYRFIPCCYVNFVQGHSQMSFDMNMVAASHRKTERRKITALVLAYCSDEHIDNFSKWLSDYFSRPMQREIFDLAIYENGKIVPEKGLEKALNKLKKEVIL